MKALILALPILLAALPCHGNPQPRGGTVAGTLTTDAKLVLKGATSQRDIVLWLEPKEKVESKTKPVTAKVLQKKLNFEPHVLPVLRGSTVEFVNEDQVKHNVFIQHDCCKLDVDTDKGETKAQGFEKVGEYPIICRLHPEMTMFVLVVDTPHFVRVELAKDKDQSTEGKVVCSAAFELKDVPAGTYTLRTWNKKLKALEREVVVAEGKVETLSLTLDK